LTYYWRTRAKNIIKSSIILVFFRFSGKIKNPQICFFADFWFLRIVPRGTLGGLLNENGSHLEVGMILA